MRALRVLTLAAAFLVTALPASASVFENLHVGVEAGTTFPADPNQYSSNWDASRGFGALLVYDLSPRSALVLRYEQDQHEFNGQAYSTFGADQVIGSDATFNGVWVGVRRHHEEGLLRAHVALYLGGVYRDGRQATLIYPTRTETHGEADRWLSAYGIGAGLTLSLEHLPDVFVEARMLWMEPEQQVPIRAGLVYP